MTNPNEGREVFSLLGPRYQDSIMGVVIGVARFTSKPKSQIIGYFNNSISGHSISHHITPRGTCTKYFGIAAYSKMGGGGGTLSSS